MTQCCINVKVFFEFEVSERVYRNSYRCDTVIQAERRASRVDASLPYHNLTPVPVTLRFAIAPDGRFIQNTLDIHMKRRDFLSTATLAGYRIRAGSQGFSSRGPPRQVATVLPDLDQPASTTSLGPR